MRNATDGHVPLPIRDRFLKRFSDDYPSRYVTVLKQENIRILQESHLLSGIGNKRTVSSDGCRPRRLRFPGAARHRTVTIPDRLRLHGPSERCPTGGPAVSLDFDRCPTCREAAIHACSVILTLSRVGNYHEQFIYRRVGCKCVSLSPPGGHLMRTILREDESGVSEVIDTILILAMTVVLFSVIIVWVAGIPTPAAQARTH